MHDQKSEKPQFIRSKKMKAYALGGVALIACAALGMTYAFSDKETPESAVEAEEPSQDVTTANTLTEAPISETSEPQPATDSVQAAVSATEHTLEEVYGIWATDCQSSDKNYTTKDEDGFVWHYNDGRTGSLSHQIIDSSLTDGNRVKFTYQDQKGKFYTTTYVLLGSGERALVFNKAEDPEDGVAAQSAKEGDCFVDMSNTEWRHCSQHQCTTDPDEIKAIIQKAMNADIKA